MIAPKASLLWLLRELKGAGYWISIETSGARVVEELFEWIDFWTVSPKGRSAETFDGDPVEEQATRLRRFLTVPAERRQFKFVIQDRRDVEDALGVLDALKYDGAVVLPLLEHPRRVLPRVADGRRCPDELRPRPVEARDPELLRKLDAVAGRVLAR